MRTAALLSATLLAGALDALRFLAAFFMVVYHYSNESPVPLAQVHPLFARGYLATDYLAGKLVRISPKGEVRMIRQFMQGSADIGVLLKSNLVIVPHMNENKVAAYDISDALK